MSQSSICIPRASRRRNKWYVKFKRSKHLMVWGALAMALVLVLGYGVVKALKHSNTTPESASPHQIVINPKFQKDTK